MALAFYKDGLNLTGIILMLEISCPGLEKFSPTFRTRTDKIHVPIRQIQTEPKNTFHFNTESFSVMDVDCMIITDWSVTVL